MRCWVEPGEEDKGGATMRQVVNKDAECDDTGDLCPRHGINQPRHTCELCGFEWYADLGCPRCEIVEREYPAVFKWAKAVIEEQIYKHVQNAFHPSR
jgi:hypothetical protein